MANKLIIKVSTKKKARNNLLLNVLIENSFVLENLLYNRRSNKNNTVAKDMLTLDIKSGINKERSVICDMFIATIFEISTWIKLYINTEYSNTKKLSTPIIPRNILVIGYKRVFNNKEQTINKELKEIKCKFFLLLKITEILAPFFTNRITLCSGYKSKKDCLNYYIKKPHPSEIILLFFKSLLFYPDEFFLNFQDCLNIQNQNI